MTSSFDEPSVKVREELDSIKAPLHEVVEYRKVYQLIE
jgi:hypothetical protein